MTEGREEEEEEEEEENKGEAEEEEEEESLFRADAGARIPRCPGALCKAGGLVCLCSVVLLVPKPLVYRVPRVFPGVIARKLFAPTFLPFVREQIIYKVKNLSFLYRS